jgi:Cupredoxin-like domain
MQKDSFSQRVVVAMPVFVALALLGIAMLFPSKGVNAQQSTIVSISVKDHRFRPGQLSAPANRPLSIKVKNLDTTPMEFESVSLRVEKVITPGSEGTVNVRALAPGRYEFFDDFHQDTRGTLIVQ